MRSLIVLLDFAWKTKSKKKTITKTHPSTKFLPIFNGRNNKPNLNKFLRDNEVLIQYLDMLNYLCLPFKKGTEIVKKIKPANFQNWPFRMQRKSDLKKALL